MAAPRKLTTSAVDRGRPLADFVAERLGIARAAAETLVRTGAVYQDGRRIEDPSHRLDAGRRITVHDPSGGASPARRSSPAAVADWIVHRDEEVLVVNKPPGVPSQATRSASAGALDRLVVDALDPAARLLHRLDREASGLVLFTRTAPAHRRFSALLARNELARIYSSVVWGNWRDSEGELAGSIGRDPRDRRRMAVGPGQPARTRFRLLRRGVTGAGEPVSLLELELVTGRTHQIRVHLAHAGHPICGDGLYGAGRRQLDRLYLHSHRLAWPEAGAIAPVPSVFTDLVG